MLELYDYYRSSACFRVRIALNFKNIEYTKHEIHLLKNGGEQYSLEYQNINPQSVVPSLKISDKIISQSFAILEYLEEIYPKPALLPKDSYQKALVREFALTIIADTHPLNNLRVLRYLQDQLNINEEQKLAWIQHWIVLNLGILEKKLKKHSAQKLYCFGEEPTFADVCLIPQIYNARRFNCDMSAFNRLLKIDDQCQKHPAFQKAWPQDPSE